MSVDIARLSAETHVSEDNFKAFVGSFPTGVTIVTWNDAVEGDGGMTVNAFASISMEPPLVMVSLAEGSRALSPILTSGTFGVNILGGSAAEAALAFARRSSARCSNFGTEPGVLGNPLLVADAVAAADCEIRQTMVAGDHTIIIGEVRQAWHRDQAPLGYLRRNFAPWV